MFLIMPDGDVFDGELAFLESHLELLERELYRLRAEFDASPDPDGDGTLDRVDALLGLSFVACQWYLNNTYSQINPDRTARTKTLQHGPRHASGVYIADLIDAAANFWKHSGEWEYKSERDGYALVPPTTTCVEVLRRAGVCVEMGRYPLGQVLCTLTSQAVPQLAFLADEVAKWRDAARAGSKGVT